MTTYRLNAAVNQFAGQLQPNQREQFARLVQAIKSDQDVTHVAETITMLTEKRQGLQVGGWGALGFSVGLAALPAAVQLYSFSGIITPVVGLSFGVGIGYLSTSSSMTALIDRFKLAIDEAFEFDLPEPEPEPVDRFEQTGPGRVTRMFYDWRRDDRERLARMQVGEQVTRARLQQLGFPGMTSASQHRPGKTMYNDLIDDMAAKGWLDDAGRWLGMEG